MFSASHLAKYQPNDSFRKEDFTGTYYLSINSISMLISNGDIIEGKGGEEVCVRR